MVRVSAARRYRSTARDPMRSCGQRLLLLQQVESAPTRRIARQPLDRFEMDFRLDWRITSDVTRTSDTASSSRAACSPNPSTRNGTSSTPESAMRSEACSPPVDGHHRRLEAAAPSSRHETRELRSPAFPSTSDFVSGIRSPSSRSSRMTMHCTACFCSPMERTMRPTNVATRPVSPRVGSMEGGMPPARNPPESAGSPSRPARSSRSGAD